MEIAEEINTTNPVNSPPPLPTTVKLCTLCTYTICICVHISAETGLKRGYLQSLKRILAIKNRFFVF